MIRRGLDTITVLIITSFRNQWLAGDITNLLGAFWQDLLPTMIILGAYYATCDVILISQG